MQLLINSIQSALWGFVGWFIPFVYSTVGVYVYDMLHFPNYSIYVYNEVSTTTQLYVEDVQPGVKYTRNRNGAILGYVGDDELIDVTNYVAHVTLEGTIIIWGRDDDPYGIFCVVIPFNTKLINVMPGVDTGVDLDVIPMPVSSQGFSSTDVRWQSTDVPGHWFISSPRVDIDVRWNRNDAYPYVVTTYHPQVTTRYEDKWFEPTFRASGTDIDSFRMRPPQISSAEFSSCLDKAALYISWLKHKYDHEPLTFRNFRRTAVM